MNHPADSSPPDPSQFPDEDDVPPPSGEGPSYPRNVRIVLVEPESPGNVGASARALKTMGFSRLVLVNPKCDLGDAEAAALAHNATDVLEGARIVSSLEEALADTVFSVGTTQRARRQGQPTYTPEEAAARMLEHRDSAGLAIVFGRESSGLSNRELELCSVLSTAPAATLLPALNLSQAVMLYVYALYRAGLAPGEGVYRWKPSSHAELEQFYKHLGDTFHRLEARPATTMESLVAKFRRVFGRIPLESRDVMLLHRMLELADEYVKKNPSSSSSAPSEPPSGRRP